MSIGDSGYKFRVDCGYIFRVSCLLGIAAINLGLIAVKYLEFHVY